MSNLRTILIRNHLIVLLKLFWCCRIFMVLLILWSKKFKPSIITLYFFYFVTWKKISSMTCTIICILKSQYWKTLKISSFKITINQKIQTQVGVYSDYVYSKKLVFSNFCLIFVATFCCIQLIMLEQWHVLLHQVFQTLFFLHCFKLLNIWSILIRLRFYN